uniref:ADAMTS like 4 n=1 Tax=Pelodiscus sinensis TaxID=13735 RepID=K7FQE4_PELSI
RSRIRESIKPGKYGYGKVPFALPLHKETAPRFKRHPEPPSDPLLLPTQVPKHKAEEAPRRKKEPPAQGKHPPHRKQQKAGPAEDSTPFQAGALAENSSELAGQGARPGHGGDRPTPHRQPHTTEQGSAGPLKAEATAESHAGLSEEEFQARGQRPRPGLHPSPEVPQWNLYHPGTETFHCEGESKQFKACRQEPCPADQPDARAVQCAAFNSQEFMGRLYQWEPFTDGKGPGAGTGFPWLRNKVGKQQAPFAQSPGPCWPSPCPPCLSPQCSQLGGAAVPPPPPPPSGQRPAVLSPATGSLAETLPLGPTPLPWAGPLPTTRLPLWRPPPSPNPPALRSRSGKSIINGNWAVDPPGRYEAGGTVFVYHPPPPPPRPAFPQMIFQQDNPGVTYRFFLAVATPDSPSHAPHSRRQDPSPAHPRPLTYPAQATPGRPSHTQGYQAWTQDLPWPGIFQALLQTTSAVLRQYPSQGAGIGLWQPLFHCVERHSQEEVEDEHCADIPKPPALDEACNTQPCPAYPCCGECGSPRGCGECGSPRGCGECGSPQGCGECGSPRGCGECGPPRAGASAGPPGALVRGAGLLRPWGGGQEGLGADCACGFPQCWAVLPSSVPRREPGGMDLLGDGWMASLSWRPQCSVECGTGIQRRSVVCLSSYANGQAEETCAGTKPADMRACNSGPCQRTVKWYTGPWSQAAGSPPPTGTQRRDVICVSKLGSEFNVTEASECAPREKPPSLQPCTGTACDARWFSTSWSACSKSCVGGVQVREVQCLTQNKTFSHLCPPDLKPVKKRACNTQPC